jgi:hypothetical protein
MNSIEQDLLALGTTADQVADNLRQMGIKGVRLDPHSCPIFNYLRNEREHIEVRGVDACWSRHDSNSYGDDADEVVIACDPIDDEYERRVRIVSTAVYQFIDKFDGGQYPDMIEQPE